jgi:hypothetical protein
MVKSDLFENSREFALGKGECDNEDKTIILHPLFALISQDYQ